MNDQPIPSSALNVGSRLQAARWESLWIEGAADALTPPLVALVGTREPDLQGLAMARKIAAKLADAKVPVLSGGALGIDAAAHAGAIDAGGRTVVVLPSGLDNLYPMRHKTLYRAVIESGGALVSPFPRETPPARWTFPRRNELLAALCDLLVVIQAPPSSGSLITAEAARKLGRRVLVVPASPDDPRGGGCLKLLRMGAEMCATPDDVIVALSQRDGPLHGQAPRDAPVREIAVRARPAAAQLPAGRVSHAHARARDTRTRDSRALPAHAHAYAHEVHAPGSLDGDPRVVYDSLSAEPRHIDEIARATSLPPARVRAALLTLVLTGLTSERSSGCYARSA